MAKARQVGRKSLIGFASTLSWLVLLVALLSTTIYMTLNSLGHIGTSASTLVSDISKNPSTIKSLVDEFKKNVDSKTAAEIDKNRAQIESTLVSLSGSKEFQDLFSSTLNQISIAILDGSSSVKVDFTRLASLVANKVNEAAKSSVISKKELAKVKPQTLDLSKQAKVVTNAHSRILEVMLAWILWLILLGVLYLLKGWRVLRSAGWQLFSIGIIFLVIRFGALIFADHLLSNSNWPTYQRNLIPQVFGALTGPMVIASAVAVIVGLVLLLVEKLARGRVDV